MAAAKPLSSPLPPLPNKFGGLPSMAIPRRPVGIRLPAHSPTPVLFPGPPSASLDSLPSPSASLSSLLSAYSNHSSESTPRSSTNSANDISGTQGSYTIASPKHLVKDSGIGSEGSVASEPWLKFSSDQDAQKQAPNISWTPAENRESLPPPPPPLKDILRKPLRLQSPPPVQPSQNKTEASPTSTSPQQDQLWRRRSLKGDKSLAVPELKLISSHGSTAASAQNSSQGDPTSAQRPQSPPQQSDTASIVFPAPPARPRVPLPRSTNAGLPGRNIRPVASRQQPPPQEEKEENMGQKLSKLRKPRDKEEAPAKPLPNPIVPRSVPRLPTPEYETTDVKRLVVETVVSPISPASSPELPDESKQARPVASQDRNNGGNQAPVLKPSNLASLRMPVGLPSSPSAHLDRTHKQPQFAARTSSRTMDAPAAAMRAEAAASSTSRAPPREQQFKPSPQVVRAISESGSTASDDTVKPRPTAASNNTETHAPPAPRVASRGGETQDEEMTDNPGAALFPRNWYKPQPADVVLDAQPLLDRHYRCLTNHRYMTVNRQRVNPISCRTCGHKDRNAECFICSACHLNVCPSCNNSLRMFRGDLNRVLQNIENKRTSEAQESAASNGASNGGPDSETVTAPTAEQPGAVGA
ncbi:hypothetical protein B0T24DRAFT_520016 [Lasiosphaeria ovina]|uniref:Uncharacterized protein n=1 Tax=Lasiosphaeria ovina TaxID=92902 RepID=A0AAE0NCZ9_9PEZI|nr:hypothetical protein B0T24DRAFT_520016 [Lasiosphaeria ovina]